MTRDQSFIGALLYIVLLLTVYRISKVDSFTIKVGDNFITNKTKITYLGCILEANLYSEKMTSKVVKKVNQ